jgi:hypothetical protein
LINIINHNEERQYMFNDKIEPSIVGSLVIRDKNTGEILVKKKNAIHQGNMAYIIACALAGTATSVNVGGGSPSINWMAFGNGGSVSTTTLAYRSPRVSTIYDEQSMSTSTSSLYAKTYETQTSSVVYFPGQALSETEYVPNSTAKIVFTVELDHNDIAAYTGATIPESDSSTDEASLAAFTFDELGLVAGVTEAGVMQEDKSLLVTHVVFHPVLLSANRTIIIDYTITIQVS